MKKNKLVCFEEIQKIAISSSLSQVSFQRSTTAPNQFFKGRDWFEMTVCIHICASKRCLTFSFTECLEDAETITKKLKARGLYSSILILQILKTEHSAFSRKAHAWDLSQAFVFKVSMKALKMRESSYKCGIKNNFPVPFILLVKKKKIRFFQWLIMFYSLNLRRHCYVKLVWIIRDCIFFSAFHNFISKFDASYN